MNIDTVNPQYTDALQRWEKNRLFCKGEMAVKAAGRKFLPDDNELIIGGEPKGKSVEGSTPETKYKYELKYLNYLRRASFTSFSQFTRNGWVGLVFNEDPTYNLPTSLEYIVENADGAGQSLIQLGKWAVSDVSEVGRAGFLSDMPPAAKSKAEEEEANVKPRILPYIAESIVDWDTETKGSLTYLSYVKLRELYFDRETDDNEIITDYSEPKARYRILRINEDGNYTNQVFDEDGTAYSELVEPTIAGGGKLKFIPFFFCGAENNKPDIDDAPISGIVDLNAAHYITSADNEQLKHLYSLPTPHLDVGERQTTEAFQKSNPRGIMAGDGLVTQGGGTFDLKQVQANNALADGLKDILENAEKIGARFAGEGNSKNVTAEAARINAASTTANLTTVTTNVSEAMEAALEVCAMFLGEDEKAVEFALNTSFYGEEPDFEAARFYEELYEKGRMSFEVYKQMMEKANIVIDGDAN